LPPCNSILIRTTSEDAFISLPNRHLYLDILEIPFDDASPNHPKGDLKYGAMSQDQFDTIHKFVNKYKTIASTIYCSCDAGQSRSPALALGILDYIVEDRQQAINLLSANKNWKPNSHVISFFRHHYYQNNAPFSS
jgi:predicted protein tyrosine phosphatase